MIWHFIRYWLSFFLPTFYKRIQGHNVRHLFTDDPVIIAMNHPNAFTDPIAFTYVSYPVRLHYMARGDAFKPGLAAWLLERIGIVPIFRIQDAGKEGLKKNEEAYRRVNSLLEKNAKVIVFAEGLSVQERRLRPLKKGVARMVFGAYEHLRHDRLKVIPVGVTYTRPDKFRSKLFYNIGEPMLVRDYIKEYHEHPARAMNMFLQRLEDRMKELVVHISDPSHEDVVHWIEKLRKKDMIKEAGKDSRLLIHELEASQEIVRLVERAAISQPEAFSRFSADARDYFRRLKDIRLKDWLFHPLQVPRNTRATLALRILLLLILSPLYVAGMIVNLPPLWLTNRVTRKIVKAVEFYSSFAFGVAMLIFPIIYGLWFVLFHRLTGNLPGALGLCLLGALSGWACLHIHPFLLRTIGLWRYLAKPLEASQLRQKRAELLQQINKF